MTNTTAAKRYARALFDVVLKEGGDLALIEEQLDGFSRLFGGHPALEQLLLNPAVPAPKKRSAVAELARLARLSSPVEKLLVLLAERDRLILLPEIVAAYRDRMMEHQQVVRAEVTTATAISSERVQAIERSLEQAIGRRVRLSARVDPAIGGGLVAKVGSTVYDGSVTTQLQKMKQRLAGAM